jgi:predicted O-methyltransferase YrrM
MVRAVDISAALAISEYSCQERTDELTWLAQQASNFKSIVEIGSWLGCTARAMADNTAGIVYCVDTCDGRSMEEKNLIGKPPDWPFQEFYRNTKDTKNIVRIISTSVHAALMLKNLRFKFDMIFIDASHDYESVKHDILAWKPLLQEGGLLCGHDRQWDGVKQAIEELCPGHRVAVGAIWCL